MSCRCIQALRLKCDGSTSRVSFDVQPIQDIQVIVPAVLCIIPHDFITGRKSIPLLSRPVCVVGAEFEIHQLSLRTIPVLAHAGAARITRAAPVGLWTAVEKIWHHLYGV